VRGIEALELELLVASRQREPVHAVGGDVPVEVALAFALRRRRHLALEEHDEREENRHHGGQSDQLPGRHARLPSRRSPLKVSRGA
jgi:hypothetical protein